MEFEESLAFDFRAKSLSALISRLEELNSALNLTPNFYIVRRPVSPPIAEQQLLFKDLLMLEAKPPQVLVVIGHKCAGKTTLSDHLIARDDVMVFEASSVLRSLAGDADDPVESADDAYKFLCDHGLDCVAHTIAKYAERSSAALNVITGLRTVEEVLLIVERFPHARIVFVEVQPGLLGLMDGSVSTLAPIFATAGLTGRPLSAFFVGLAASLGAAISMGLSEALSDDGSVTGHGSPLRRGAITGFATGLGGMLHTLPIPVSESGCRDQAGLCGGCM